MRAALKEAPFTTAAPQVLQYFDAGVHFTHQKHRTSARTACPH
jgi:hypothetical protein